jgi:hypothetical protein
MRPIEESELELINGGDNRWLWCVGAGIATVGFFWGIFAGGPLGYFVFNAIAGPTGTGIAIASCIA